MNREHDERLRDKAREIMGLSGKMEPIYWICRRFLELEKLEKKYSYLEAAARDALNQKLHRDKMYELKCAIEELDKGDGG